MDDRDLETRLAARLHRRFDDAEAPRELRASLDQAFATQPRRLGFIDLGLRDPMRLGFSLTAAVAAVVVLAIAASSLGLHLGPIGAGGSPSPSAGPTQRSFIVLPASAATPSKAQSIVAGDTLNNRLLALGVGNFVTATGYGMTLTLPIDGPTDETIRAVLRATGDAAIVPLPLSDYGPGQLTAVVGQALPKSEPALIGRDGISKVALDGASPAGIVITLTPSARQLFADYTSAHVGDVVAITVDGSVAFLPVITAPITDGVLKIATSGSTPPLPGVETAVLVGGMLPEAWRDAQVPIVISRDAAIVAARGQAQVTVKSADLQAIPKGAGWQTVWNVVLLGSFPVECAAGPTEPPHLVSCPPPASTKLVVVDAISGAILSSEAPAP